MRLEHAYETTSLTYQAARMWEVFNTDAVRAFLDEHGSTIRIALHGADKEVKAHDLSLVISIFASVVAAIRSGKQFCLHFPAGSLYEAVGFADKFTSVAKKAKLSARSISK